jgi:hypothetical protein
MSKPCVSPAVLGVLLACPSSFAQPAIGAAMDRSPDGSIIVAMFQPDISALDLIRVGADNSLLRISRVGCPPVSSLVAVDSNGDGIKEFAISLDGSSSIVVLSVDQSGFTGAQVVQTDEPSVGLITLNQMDGGPATLAAVGTSGIAYTITTVASGDVVSGSRCDTTWEQCSATCSCTPIAPGIQECLEAARCRSSNCHWAACILRESGEYGQIRTNLANIACGAVYAIEMATCFPLELVNQ